MVLEIKASPSTTGGSGKVVVLESNPRVKEDL